MKIALVSMPRVGSNSLFDDLKKEYGYDYKHEPYTVYRNEWDFNSFNVGKDFLFKTLIYQVNKPWDDRNFYEWDKTSHHYGTSTHNGSLKWNKLNWYDTDTNVIKFISKIDELYDKVIYLDGADMDRMVESYVRAYLTNEWFKKTDYSVKLDKDKYVVSKDLDKKHYLEFLTYYQKILRTFAKDENYFTYEGLFKTKEESEKLLTYLSEEIV